MKWIIASWRLLNPEWQDIRISEYKADHIASEDMSWT